MISMAKSIVSKLTRLSATRMGFDLVPRTSSHNDEKTQRILEQVKPYTMTSTERILALCDAVDYITARGLEGDIVECGVWKGGSSMAAALSLLKHGETERLLYLYDTFDGMSVPTEFDREIGSGKAAKALMNSVPKEDSVWAYSPLEEVRANLARTRYPSEKLNFIQGKVEDTIPGRIPGKIAILRLDTDWYESTRHELEHLYPLLVTGGVLIIDDYGHWDGARRAVDEYFSRPDRAALLARIDYTGRMTLKV